ncbi:tannase/feruloyl esterase family alpha/beta hydrolase [Dactylosporangium sp. AC04546]|uniref:tannase/feruloyl esterase family alpha/beta hydrolase n=1 Tax=Dactylosporangium sp. AC04546 TaxID=2862460 RepID=UPI001EDD58B9|nr:tannase/feruloyl esterase family alpha/beta hydrolase [Dactylosporangium sp. AC04546]WVK88747.1 tannase/feruloyl esterase family alpha/beta hydrolase [Dactylosporangium sp. AC04546]
MSRRVALAAAMVLVAGLACAGAVVAASLAGRGAGGCPRVAAPQTPGAQVLSVSATARSSAGAAPRVPGGPGVPARCDVTVVLTHPPAGDRVRIRISLPTTTWNGRFQAVGGGGFAAGNFGHALDSAVRRGYAAASTDAGVPMSRAGHPTWALRHDRTIDTALLDNFAYRSVHDMSRIGEQVTTRFYGRPPTYSYFTGCSTGGRQGLVEAQRYPGDFDGILAAAPAISWNRLNFAQLWPQVVMNETGVHPTACELAAFNRAAVAACDGDDGLVDGVIGRPETCRFDPGRLVGTTVHCRGAAVRISPAVADLVRRIWHGPTTRTGRSLWYGLLPGASFGWLAGTTKPLFGPRQGVPFPVAADWVRYFVQRRPAFDPSTIGYAEFEQLLGESLTRYSDVIESDEPDLSAFRAAGGKMLTWHGLADQVVFPQGTLQYRRRVDAAMGGTHATDQFYRVFLAPGVAHCTGGAGPAPRDPLAALVDWVEHGRAPDTLPATTTGARRPRTSHDLCRYPHTAAGGYCG